MAYKALKSFTNCTIVNAHPKQTLLKYVCMCVCVSAGTTESRLNLSSETKLLSKLFLTLWASGLLTTAQSLGRELTLRITPVWISRYRFSGAPKTPASPYDISHKYPQSLRGKTNYNRARKMQWWQVYFHSSSKRGTKGLFARWHRHF